MAVTKEQVEAKLSEPVSIMAALLRAQKAIAPIVRDATNPHFKSKYATEAAVLAVVLPALQAEGLCLWHRSETGGLRTLIAHTGTLEISETGAERLTAGVPWSFFPIAPTDNPQKWAAAMTYGRRHNTVSLLSIPQEDDDGNTAAAPKSPARRGGVPLAEIKKVEMRIDMAKLSELLDAEFKDNLEQYVYGWGEEGEKLLQRRLDRIRKLSVDHEK